MDLVTALFALIPTILLFVQGVSCLRRTSAPLYVRRFGFLCGILSGLSLVLCLLLASGSLVLSSEFSIVMVQGALARFSLAVLLVGSALAAGMGLQVCCLAADRRTRLAWLLGPGLIVGFLAIGRIYLSALLLLNPDDAEPFRIYAYDLWWPPLLIYLSACLVESALSILRFHQGPVRLWVATALIAGLALLALSQPQFGDPTSAVLWKSFLLLLLPASISLVTWLFFRSPCHKLTRMRLWIRRGLTVLPVSIGLLSSIYWIWGMPLSLMMTSWPWLLWLSWPLLVGLGTPHQLYRAWCAGREDWQALPRPTFQPVILLVAIAVIALSLAALVSLVSINRPLALVGFVSAWVLLAEAIAGGPLRTISALLISREFWPALRTRLTAISAYVGSVVRALLSVNSWPAAVVKTLVGLCLLMALNELPNAGETRIQPFKVAAILGRNESGQSLVERNELGESLAERVVNILSTVQKDLKKEIVPFLYPDAEEAPGEVSFALVSPSESTSLGGTALGKSDDLTVGNVKIPLSLLVAPIQGPIQWLLGVHLINGSLQAEQQGYSLLASSTAGETWKVIWLPTDSAQQVTSISPSCRRLPAMPTISPHDIVASLANEFAFKIMLTDPTLAPTMTKSWEAFQFFKAGLKHWKEFEAQQDVKVLHCAIALFREATARDAGFAFAYYRLGLALQRAGQPVRAAKAFQAGLKADSTFVPASIALASLLSDSARDSEPTVSTSAPSPAPQMEGRRTRINQARQLWQQIIDRPAWAVSVPNRASAYYGLCRQARQAARQARSSSDVEREHYLAYYYCQQAAALYASLPDARRAKSAIKIGEASVLHTLGMTVGHLQRQRFMGQPPEWACGRRDLWQSPYSRSALRYYRQALALLPDDHRIRCSTARAEYVLGVHEPIHRLRADPEVHVALANRYRKAAKDSMANDDPALGANKYLKALTEYQEAIDREPTHIEALTGYAFTFEEWRANLWSAKDPHGPDRAIAQQAVKYARKANELAADKLDPVIKAMVRCEPGKVLLTQARPTEPIKELYTANGNHAYRIGSTWGTPLCDAEFSMKGMSDH